MRSAKTKVMHPVAGKPMLTHVVETAQQLSPENIHVIYGNGGSDLPEQLSHLPVHWVHQEKQLGTGHALLQALAHISESARVLVLSGDVPLISVETLQHLLHEVAKHTVGLLVADVKNPSGLGRIVRNQDSNIIAIVESKDASPDQLKISEINTGILTALAKNLAKWLPSLKNNNAQNEYYLTDIISLAVSEGLHVVSVVAQSPTEVQGINDRIELARAERNYQRHYAEQLLRDGVMLMDPARFDCRGNLSCGRDVTIDINVIFSGDVTIGDNTQIGASSVLHNVTIGKDVVIHPHCVLEDTHIADGCVVGPFARLRPGTVLENDVRVGNFVEIKKTRIGAGSKACHLSYLGDAVIGADVNIGAGTITCNYDGVDKHATTIGDGVFVGSNTALVAPINLGENAVIGAGSTLTKDTPANELTLARARQETIKGWKKRQKS